MKIRFTNPTGVTARHLKNAVAKDPLPPVIQGVFIDLKNKRLVATNGYILVAYPIDVDETDSLLPQGLDGVIVPVRFFDDARYMMGIPPKTNRTS